MSRCIKKALTVDSTWCSEMSIGDTRLEINFYGGILIQIHVKAILSY